MWRFSEKSSGTNQYTTPTAQTWVNASVLASKISGPDYSDYFEKHTSYIKIIKSGYYRLTFNLTHRGVDNSRGISGIFLYDGSYIEKTSASNISNSNTPGSSTAVYYDFLNKDELWYFREYYNTKYLSNLYTWAMIEYLGTN